MFKVFDLFSGIGGFSLGLERTGKFKTIAFCEVNEFCNRILRKHWPEIPNLGDITKIGIEPMSSAEDSPARTYRTQADAGSRVTDTAGETRREDEAMSNPVIIGNATLYLGDCRDILPTLPKVDAVITDPPFGVGFKYESHADTAHGYIDWLWPVIEQAEALCNPGSPIFVWQSGTNVRRLGEWFPREWRLFVAGKNFVQMRPTAMQWAYDPVLCWWTASHEKPWALGTASRDYYVANTAPVVASPLNIEKQHPCPRPLDLLMHMVGQWAKPGSCVLDAFMGSGTTGVACMNLGRKFIGIEIERKYFDIACRRIEDAQRQQRLLP